MKKDTRVLIFVFILHILFSQLVWDDNINRVYLSLAIAKNQNLSIEEYSRFIGDFTTAGNIRYSSKSPGVPFFLSSIVFLINKIAPLNDDIILLREDLSYNKYFILETPLIVKIASILGIIIFSAIPGTLIVLILRKYTKNIYIAALLYFSTFLFPFSTTFFSYTFSILLILYAFYRKHIVLTPLFLGLSVLIEFTSIFLVLTTLYFMRKDVDKKYFIIGILPTILYLASFYPVTIWNFNLVKLELMESESKEFITSNIFEALRDIAIKITFLLLSPYRGLLLYSPILFLFFIYYYKIKNKKLKNITIMSFLVYLLFNSTLIFWWGSLSFGPRYLIFPTIFMIISIATIWKNVDRKLITLLLVASILITFTSFTYWEGARKYGNNGKDFYLLGVYKKGEIKFDNEIQLATFSPLIEHYFPSFIENGPRSKLIESLFTERPFDIRYLLPEDRDYITIVYKYPPYLSALIVIFLIFILFWKELIERKLLLLSFLVIITYIILYNLNHFGFLDTLRKVNKTEIKFGFYTKDFTGNIFISNRGTVYIFSSESEEKLLSIAIKSFAENRKVFIILNGNKLRELNVSNEYDTEIYLPIYIKKGKNILEIYSDKCLRPISLGFSNDKRCLSLFLKSIEVLKLDREEPIFSEGWFVSNMSEKHMGPRGKIYIYSNATGEQVISITSKSFIKDRNISLYLNSEFVGTARFFREGSEISIVAGNLTEGWNVLEIESEDCSIPSDEDKRCISIIVSKVSIKPIDKSKDYIIFSSGWYLPTDNFRWMSTHGKIYISSNTTQSLLLYINATSFLVDRNVIFYINSELIDEVKIFKEGSEIVIPFKNPVIGLNEIEIYSYGCSYPSYEDRRCISIGILNISIKMVSEIDDEIIFSEGWYIKTKEDYYRWGDDFVKLIYISSTDKTVIFHFDILPIFNELVEVEFYLNGEHKNTFEIAKGGGWVYTLPQKVKNGINYLEFRVPKGCLIIDDILHNGDKRCIAMTLRGIKVEK